jgi:hypothetical protein
MVTCLAMVAGEPPHRGMVVPVKIFFVDVPWKLTANVPAAPSLICAAVLGSHLGSLDIGHRAAFPSECANHRRRSAATKSPLERPTSSCHIIDYSGACAAVSFRRRTE